MEGTHEGALPWFMAKLGIVHPGPHEESAELSARQTGMSFQRTRLSADRTLMSVIRTSLSLISFGFTIYQFFQHLVDAQTLSRGHEAARRFGISLVGLGIAMLVIGIGYHLAFMRQLRVERQQMTAEGLIHGESKFPISQTIIVALALLVVGLLAIFSLMWRAGPFR